MKNLLTTKEVAICFNVCARTVQKWCAKKWLKPIRITARCVRFHPDDLHAFEKARRIAMKRK